MGVPLGVGCMIGVHVTHFGMEWATEEFSTTSQLETTMQVGYVVNIRKTRVDVRYVPIPILQYFIPTRELLPTREPLPTRVPLPTPVLS